MKILKHFLVVFLVEALLLGALFIWMPKQKNSNILASESKGENTIVLTKSNEETVTITAKNKETTKERDFTIFDEKKLSADIEWKNAQSAQVKIIGKNQDLYDVTVTFNGNKIEIRNGENDPLISYEETMKLQKEQEKKAKEEAMKKIEKMSAPTIALVKDITKDSDIENGYASTPAKPQAPITEEQNAQVNHGDDGALYDMKIEAGKVMVTLDGGGHWVNVPVNGSRLQDYWLTFYRMGNQSYYIDADMIMIAYCEKYQQPHIIMSKDQGKTWKDIRIDCESAGISQISIAKDKNHTYRIAMMSGDYLMFTGTSTDGINWTFDKPSGNDIEKASTMYSMALMKDGTILVTSFDDCLISKDHGKTYTSLKEINPIIAQQINHQLIPYDEDGTYCIPLKNGKVAKSKDGTNWE